MNIIYAHTTNTQYVRVKKNLEYFDTLNANVIFFGARRAGQKVNKESDKYSNIKIIYFDKILQHGWRSLVNFVAYLYRLNRLIKKNKPDVLVLTNEELYLSLLFVNRNKTKVVIDAIDALDIRVETNFLMKKILNKFVKYVRAKSNKIVEVEDFRKERFPQYINKTSVIKNTPNVLNQNFKSSKSFHQECDYIYASGSLNQNINGLEVLIDALDIVNSKKNTKIKLIIAGIILGDELSKKIKNNHHVSYIGSISLEESHYLASKSIAMFAFYKPDRLNFIYAAPNKVYESFMLGKPLLINEECIISKFCKEKGNGYVSKYNDEVELSNNILNIIDKPYKFSNELKEDFKQTMSWEKERKKWSKVINH